MRFSFRKEPAPRWVDGADLHWTPEEPLFYGSGFASDESFGNFARGPAPERVVPRKAANTSHAPNLLLVRLGIGMAQGLGLYALLQLRAAGAWPGSDPYLFAALALAGLFSPLVLLEGLGEIPTTLLLLWTGIVAALLASLGLYHHWRIQGPEQAHAGLALVLLTGLMLVTAQALLRAAVRDGKVFAGYRASFDAAWTLIARLAVWLLITGLVWALVGSGNSLFNWLRANYPMLRLTMEPTLLTLPLVGFVSAGALHLTATDAWPRRQARNALLACCTVALPILVIVSAVIVIACLRLGPPVMALSLSLALLLVIAINASYRGESPRGKWRKYPEFAAAFLSVALVGMAWAALQARVTEFGWTSARIYAGATLALLGLYGFGYSAAALISIGGGRWMQRIEPVNRVMALLLMAVCLALASPLADPLQLAVTAQTARLQTGKVDPAVYDFDYLHREGVRFGQQALAAMAQSGSPEIARDAAVTLASARGGDVPTPTEIGANITVHTAGARLPSSLLVQDWMAAGPNVPPCLTRPALSCDAWFLDLDRDGANEILLVYGTEARWWAAVLKENLQGWAAAAAFASPSCRGTLAALRSGRFALADPLPGWRDLLVAGMRISAKPAQTAELPCPALTSTNPN